MLDKFCDQYSQVSYNTNAELYYICFIRVLDFVKNIPSCYTLKRIITFALLELYCICFIRVLDGAAGS